SHPGFSKLFVQTEFDAGRAALLAHRRPRASGERHPVLVHAFVGGGETVEFETDRVRFIGRGATLAAPRGVNRPLSGTSGAVLDPIVSLRRRVRIPPSASTSVTFLVGAAADRMSTGALLDRAADAQVESWRKTARAVADSRQRAASLTASQAERLETV